MSFITDIIEYGLGKFGITVGLQSSAIASTSISNLIADYANTATATQNKTSEAKVDRREIDIKLPLTADPENKIPVIYGQGVTKGLLTDAVLTNDGCTMWWCITLCEHTGTRQSLGIDSQIFVQEIYYNDQLLGFDYDGVTVAGSYDYEENRSIDIGQKLKIYLYSGGSESPSFVQPQGHPVTHGNAYDVFPTWSSTDQMSDLVFALVRLDYDATTNADSIGNLKFVIRNTMSAPGDVLYDYMTNSVYGAGIPTGEIDL